MSEKREHVTDGKPCWCGPEAKREEETIIWVHRQLPPCPDCEGLRASLAASESRVRELLDYARHTHEARYFKDESGKMRLTDSCGKCNLDLRHEIHAAYPAPSAPKPDGLCHHERPFCHDTPTCGLVDEKPTPPRPDAKPEAGHGCHNGRVLESFSGDTWVPCPRCAAAPDESSRKEG